MKQEKARRAAEKILASYKADKYSRPPYIEDPPLGEPQAVSLQSSSSGVTAAPSTLRALQVSKSSFSSGVMTGYESDDEAENNEGTETDDGSGSSSRPLSSHTPFCPGRKQRGRVEIEYEERETEDLRASKKLRFVSQAPQHSHSATAVVTHSSTVVSEEGVDQRWPLKTPTDSESADSGYEAGPEGVGQRRRSLTNTKGSVQEGISGEEISADRDNSFHSGLVDDFFDVSSQGVEEDVSMEYNSTVPSFPPGKRYSASIDEDNEKQETADSSQLPDWVQHALEAENLRVEEEYILEGSDDNESRSQYCGTSVREDRYGEELGNELKGETEYSEESLSHLHETTTSEDMKDHWVERVLGNVVEDENGLYGEPEETEWLFTSRAGTVLATANFRRNEKYCRTGSKEHGIDVVLKEYSLEFDESRAGKTIGEDLNVQ